MTHYEAGRWRPYDREELLELPAPYAEDAALLSFVSSHQRHSIHGHS